MSRAAVKPTYHQTSLDEARERARVDEEGHVYLKPPKRGSEEIYVGQYSAAGEEQALAYFTRKFDELYNRALLLGARVATQADGAKSLRASRIALLKELDDGAWVGDVSALRALLAEIEGGIESIAAEEEKAHQALAEERLAAREEIVVEAEQLAAGDEESTHWKNAQARMAELFEAWKAEQRTTPRLSKAQEDPLWKRFREARSTFERRRKAFFVKRDKDAAEIKKAKDEIIAEAEKLSASRDFGPTTKAYHRLMDQWKALGRGPRKTEDAQWKRFRAAQDVFFSARDQANAQTDAEFAENLRVKEDILSKLRELMPFTKPAAVRERYFKLIDEWDAAGKVPRQDVKRMERSLAEVQDAFREASSTTKAESASPKDERQEAMLAQLEDTIAGLERDLAHARESNDSKAISEAEEALAARRSWLQMLKSA